MQISFHGAARTVTGSQHLLEINGRHILLDCGLFQGRRSEAFEINRHFGFDPKKLSAVILSHAHIDHSGNLPSLVKAGYDGPIYSTHATRDLCASMLPDSGHIQEKDVEFVNKKRKRSGEPPVQPLYTQEDAFRSLHNFISTDFNREIKLFEGIYFRFKEAGHMLGSAFVVLDLEDREAGRDIRLVFSGDLGHKGLPIIRDPETVDYADILIMESTYGGRAHPPMPDTADKLQAIIHRIVRDKGVLIIPAFAVGRTQQVVYTLQQLHSEGKIPILPIFVDSPLAIDATHVFRQHPECYDGQTRRYITEYDDPDIFGFQQLKYTRRVEESKALNTMEPPFVVISASGMMENGRILHHLRNRIEAPQNVVLVTGWQAPNTLGRRLLDGVSPVRIFGLEHPVRAQVEVINGLSGHADSQELVDWVRVMTKLPKHTFLVHGELDAAQALTQHLQKDLELDHIHIPEPHQSFGYPET
jgi:metallo-beta-lactamase family protein